MNKSKAAEILNRAADRLMLPNSWTRHVLYQRDPSAPDGIQACALGTIDIVAGQLDRIQLVENLLNRNHMRLKKAAIGCYSIVGWNDDLAGNKEAVAEAFRKMACVLAMEAEQDAVVNG